MHLLKDKKRIVFVIAGMTLVIAVLALFTSAMSMLTPSPKLTRGKWDSPDSSWWLGVDAETIAVGREGEPSFAILPHKVNGRRIYDQNDLAKAHPYRLKLLDDGSVKLIREASGPSPKYEKTFRLSVRF